MLGHSFLNSTFGVVPRHAWQADAFGHSNAITELLIRSGLKSIFFSRVSTQERNYRKSNKELEFLWQPKFVKDGLSFTSSGIFTHILNNNYAAPCKLDVY